MSLLSFVFLPNVVGRRRRFYLSLPPVYSGVAVDERTIRPLWRPIVHLGLQLSRPFMLQKSFW